MTYKKNPFRKAQLLSLLLFAACSSKPVFQPEVAGEGAKSSHGSVVYSIPAQHPVLRMKLVAMAISKKNMLNVQMFFLRHGAPAGEYMDPREQSIVLPDSTTNIYPSRVHAIAAGKPLIRLADAERQTVELQFSIPKGGQEFPYIKLQWKLHYTVNGQEQSVAQTEKFDLVEKESPQRSVGDYYNDQEFPYVGIGEYDTFPNEWSTPGWIWW